MENNKPRLEATHFVEVWRGVYSKIANETPLMLIDVLDEVLEQTKREKLLETILVAKIKFKPCKK